MGYTTDFEGQIAITPPLNEHETSYLTELAATRRMDRTRGPFYLGEGFHGQVHEDDVINHNRPHRTQPGLWLQWVPTEDGTAFVWDGMEKFYNSVEWMSYLIATFLRSDAVLQLQLQGGKHPGWFYDERFEHFTFDHVLNGVIKAQGEDDSDRWDLIVKDNGVAVQEYSIEPVDEDSDEHVLELES